MGGSWGVLADKTDQERGGSVFWDPLGAILAASWAVLAASWGRLSGLAGLLGPSWARLGGRNRTPSRPNIDPKIDQNFMPLGIIFLKDFNEFCEVKWKQVGSKIEAKMDLNSKGRKSTKR